jgi:eukaryotic-like serine/threonine-protein kinase
MAYCHECGEQVAPEDVFCPYCGISLSPSVQPVGEAEPSASTKTQEEIPFTPPPIEIPSEPIPEPEVVVKEVSLPAIPPEFESNPSFSGDLLKKQTEEQLQIKTEEVQDIERHIPTGDWEVAPVESQSANQSEPFKESEISAPPPVAGEKDVQIEQPAVSEITGKNSESAIETDRNVEPNFDATIPYSPKDFAKHNLNVSGTEAKQAAENESRESEKIQDAVFKPEFPESAEYEEDLNPTLISSPLPELPPESEIPKPPPQNQFASEIEKTPSVSAPVEANVPPPQFHEGAPSAEVSTGEEPRSHTRQNVNAVDTGGKKTKLKTLSEGTVLNGRYEIVRKIGGGGMGAVYLASDRNLGGILRAVKEMVQSHIEEEQQDKAISDFKRESLLLTSLEHPAIPTIFDYFYDDKESRFYLVMKYISGGDLAARLRAAPEGRIDEKSVTEWAIQIADVLDYLHNRQPPIVYRDLKPSNIMIDGNTGKVMLIDFGIARWVNKEEKGVTAVGTMGYAPPELFSGNVEPRSDIYSLGSTMFHLLTGADPQNNPLLIFDFQKHPRPRQINPSLSDQIEKILMRAVEYNVEKRFTSAREMRDALNQHLQNLETGRLTFGAGDRAVAAPVPDAQPVFCGFCGQRILANDMFCPFCGAKQPLAAAAAPPASVAPVYSAPKLTAKLYIVNTTELEAPVFNLEKDTSLIGRRDPMSNIFPEVDLSKYDPQTKISRRHARIWRDGENYMVEDLGSSNGTTLLLASNESVRLLPRQPRVLSHGDKLKLGDTTLHFVVG